MVSPKLPAGLGRIANHGPGRTSGEDWSYEFALRYFLGAPEPNS